MKNLKILKKHKFGGMSHYKQWSEQYKDTMAVASHALKEGLYTIPLESYCGNEYQGINQFMRNGTDNKNNKYRELSDILTIVLCSAPRIPCNLVLYRLVNEEFIEKLIERNKENTPLPIQEKGFMSISLLKYIAGKSESYVTGNTLLKIYVPKETVGVYVNAVTQRNEEEVLLLQNLRTGKPTSLGGDDSEFGVGTLLVGCRKPTSISFSFFFVV